MGTIYVRGRILWTGITPLGATKQECKSSGLIDTPENRARLQRAMDKAEAKIAKEKSMAEALGIQAADMGPLTVRRYGGRWIEGRRARGLLSPSQEKSRLAHFYSVLGEDGVAMGDRLVTEVRQKHVRDVFRKMTAACGPGPEQLAPRTVRGVHAAAKAMFLDVVSEELLESTPCILARADLPKVVDKDPAWRDGASYVREEVEQLISDERVPEHRRVRYAVLFLAGPRIGELGARRLRDYDPTMEPLGALKVETSYSRARGKVGPTKTGKPRRVPVHPVLAKVLAGWKLGGWERLMGRPPTPDDLLCPRPDDTFLDDKTALQDLRVDLDTLGMRQREIHDMRSTFISLTQEDGVPENLLKWVTHGRPGTIVGGYTRNEWAMLCAEVSKLKLSLREGRLLSLPKAVNAASDLLQPLLQSSTETENLMQLRAVIDGDGELSDRRTRSNRETSQSHPEQFSPEVAGVYDETGPARPSEPKPHCSNVVTLTPEQAAQIRAALEAVTNTDDHADPEVRAMVRAALALLPENSGGTGGAS